MDYNKKLCSDCYTWW